MSLVTRERRTNLAPALAGAALLHAGVFAFFLWKGTEPPADLTISAVPVNIVSDIPASAPSNLPDPPAEAAAELAPAEEPPAEAAPPPPAPTPPAPAPTPPKKLTPTPAAKPVKPPPARPSRQLNADSILDSVAEGPAKARRTPPRSPTPPTKASERPGGSTNTGPISATGQVALGALTRRLQENWILACDSGADKVVARVRFRLSSTGQLVDGPDLVERQSGSVWQAAAERATRAVRASAPFTDLPDELLNREIVIKFNGETACRGR